MKYKADKEIQGTATSYETRRLDKTYVFKKSTGPDEIIEVVKTEDELTKSDKDLIHGHFIHEFKKLPYGIQRDVLRALLPDSLADELDWKLDG